MTSLQKTLNRIKGILFNTFHYRAIKASLKYRNQITRVDLYLIDGSVERALPVTELDQRGVNHTNHGLQGRYSTVYGNILRIVFLGREPVPDFNGLEHKFTRAIYLAREQGIRTLVLTEPGYDGIVRKYYITESSRMYTVDGFKTDYPWVTLAEFRQGKLYTYSPTFFGIQHAAFDSFVEEVIEKPPVSEVRALEAQLRDRYDRLNHRPVAANAVVTCAASEHPGYGIVSETFSTLQEDQPTGSLYNAKVVWFDTVDATPYLRYCLANELTRLE